MSESGRHPWPVIVGDPKIQKCTAKVAKTSTLLTVHFARTIRSFLTVFLLLIGPFALSRLDVQP